MNKPKKNWRRLIFIRWQYVSYQEQKIVIWMVEYCHVIIILLYKFTRWNCLSD